MIQVLTPIFIFLVLYLLWNVYKNQKTRRSKINLPPGSFGWPFLGESLALLRAHWDGVPERFVEERIQKHGSPLVFKTLLLGERMAVLCGPAGNKFVFGNENKLVAAWWPLPMRKLFGRCLVTIRGDEAKWTRKMLLSYLGPDAFATRYAATMDVVTRRHIELHWQGTRFYSANNAANAIRTELMMIIKARRMELEEGKVSSSQDLLSHFLTFFDENGRYLTEKDIANNILLLLFAGHDTSTVSITLLIKSLGEHPDVYDKVLKEQLEISKAKEARELLNWDDIQKMRYSWNVVSEVMRLNPPATGAFREALVDIEYAGYTIPKGWKIYLSVASTHKDMANFEDVTRFDPSRFEGAGPTPFTYVPFGGGPRMCLGKEFARMKVLAFLNNIITNFKWEVLIPDEKIEYDPMPTPVKGFPIRLHPHHIE
ncbi:putative cytochrome P450 [Helianthus annuus]|uniref:Cytochrome P450 n=1 Tax=Helianthus annuus TaxID=4232 RepID=A0A251SJN4_HELAN|nr:beta-amyrin 28-monooxygenase [Helianthus annuus]KAF5768546.1 putative cytochrome P450 [Helianthus annuus]KAJ0463778.1 putative cytochrome P450 [Helianthus annuus]KAJ0485278.1 putative cytochrome P450 [Helianthus annuus]KAJ0655826.1 putative cytochrome P450 [Helianthus annuus]KAJ0659507.1 putative cytochrome P450 [Helianthus annuus]